MWLKSIEIDGFRGQKGLFEISHPVAIIAGPNNSGKSTVIDAIRSVLQPLDESNGMRSISRHDFTHSADGSTAENLSITLNFSSVDAKHRGKLISILSPRAGLDTARITLEATRMETGRPRTRLYGGDYSQNDVEYVAREGLNFIYLPALRDAESELRPGLRNRVGNLISAKAPDGKPERDAIVEIVKAANRELLANDSIKSTGGFIQERLDGMTGSGPFEQKTALGLSEPQFERIVGNIQSFIGAQAPGELAASGLGYNNLLYIAVVLAVIEIERDNPFTILLIEEPEAHLHPQLQALLMSYFEKVSTLPANEGMGGGTNQPGIPVHTKDQDPGSDQSEDVLTPGIQVLLTTHSSQFASAASVERLTVLSTGGGWRTI